MTGTAGFKTFTKSHCYCCFILISNIDQDEESSGSSQDDDDDDDDDTQNASGHLKTDDNLAAPIRIDSGVRGEPVVAKLVH